MKRRSRNNEIRVDGTKKRSTNEALTPIVKTALSLPNERNKMKNQTTTKTENGTHMLIRGRVIYLKNITMDGSQTAIECDAMTDIQ